jgi:hypothetical protein
MNAKSTTREGGTMQDSAQVYCTAEQLHRLAGLACDALVGIEFSTDCADNSPIEAHFVPIDNPNGGMRFFVIEADGVMREET